MTASLGNPMNLTLTSDREISVTRLFDAPRNLVWKAMNDCESLGRWWGPRGYDMTECTIDLRVGGGYRFVHRDPGGESYGFRGTYHELQAPERAVYTQIFDLFPNDEAVIATTLTDVDGKTLLSLTMRFPSKEARDGTIASGMEAGQRQSYERLDEVLAELAQRDVAGPELEISREFDAPRELVWKAWTDPAAFAAWFGAAGTEVAVARFELRPGGVCLYNQKAPNGPEIWGRVVYREVAPIERLVFVNSFSDASGGLTANPWMPGWPLEILNTVTLEDLGARTRLNMRGAPMNASADERRTFDQARPGISGGFAGTFAKLDEWLVKQLATTGR